MGIQTPYGAHSIKIKDERPSPGVKLPGGEAEISWTWPSLRMIGVTPPHPHIVMARKGTTNN